MPSGVEHKNPGGASRYARKLITVSMPSGVEHLLRQERASYRDL